MDDLRDADPLLPLLMEELFAANITYNCRVFTNRSLRLDKVEWIGFDMDYTLALYRESVEALAFHVTLQKLVERGYPEEILHFPYDPTFAIRGLVIDHQRGNLLKMDRYRHVSRVYHGFARVSDDERRQLYRQQRMIFSSDRYHVIDTLFGMPETFLYAKLVDFLESSRSTRLGESTFHQLFHDIRDSIDAAHQDDTIKSTILSDIERFVYRDHKLALTLHKFRSAGKKLFLMTNSYYRYTDALMTYLFAGELPQYPSWKNYFDVIIVGAKKPQFFAGHNLFVEVLDDGELSPATVAGLFKGHVYQSGNLGDFNRWVNARSDGILYVGDHIYGDILKSKKSTLWRTAMVVQEMQEELSKRESMIAELKQRTELDDERATINDEIDRYQLLQRSLIQLNKAYDADPTDDISRIAREAERKCAELRRQYEKNLEKTRALDAKIEFAFNPHWGKLFKDGVEQSLFGDQVEEYACVYTSKVSNFINYSPNHYFRSPRDPMAHEHYLQQQLR